MPLLLSITQRYLYDDYHVDNKQMALTLTQLGEAKLPSAYDFAYAMYTLEMSIDAVNDRLGRHVRESMTTYRNQIVAYKVELNDMRASYKALPGIKGILTCFMAATTWKSVCEAFDLLQVQDQADQDLPPWRRYQERELNDEADAVRATKRERENDAKADIFLLFETILNDTMKEANHFDEIAPAANDIRQAIRNKNRLMFATIMLNEYQRNSMEEMDEVYKNVKALAKPVLAQVKDEETKTNSNLEDAEDVTKVE